MSTQQTAFRTRSEERFLDRLENSGLSTELKNHALAIFDIGNMTSSGQRFKKVNALLSNRGLGREGAKEVIEQLIIARVAFVSASGRSVTFREVKPKIKKRRLCVYCQKTTSSPTVDHVIPKVQLGADDESNKVFACESCNLSKGSRTPTQWARDVLNYKNIDKPALTFLQRFRLAVHAFAAVMAGGAK